MRKDEEEKMLEKKEKEKKIKEENEKKREAVKWEIRRVIDVIDERQKDLEKVVINPDLFFNEEMIGSVRGMYVKGRIIAYNGILSGTDFPKYNRKGQFKCLSCYKEDFIKILDNDLF